MKLIRNIFNRKGRKLASQINGDWVDQFIANVRDYVFIREEDLLLIKRPNQAVKLNPTGARILKSLLNGLSIHQLFAKLDYDPRKMKEALEFIYAVKLQLEGKNEQLYDNPAVETVPFTMNFSDYPVLSEIALTYRCNLKCNFCYAGCNCKSTSFADAEEMTVDQVKTVIDKIFHEAKVPSISFTGGEPTLVDALPDLIAHAKSLGMRVNLISNGTHIDRELAATLADQGLDSAQISLEASHAKLHDRIVNQEGAFAKSVDAVAHLKQVGVLTHTNTTITRDNLDDCTKMPEFVKNHLGNERFSMNVIIPTGTATVNSQLMVRYSEMAGILSGIMEKSEEHAVTFMWYSPVPMCMFNSVAHGLGNKGCSACDGLVSIAPNGDVLPCSSFNEAVGNLIYEDFNTVWNSRAATRLRHKDLAHQACRDCEDFHICHGACPLYWRQMGFGELEDVLSRQNQAAFADVS